MTDRREDSLDALLAGVGGADDDDGPLPDAVHPPSPRRRRAGRRTAVVALAIVFAMLAALLAGGAVFVTMLTRSLDRNIERIGDPFADVPAESRPIAPAASAKAVNVLVVGSDSRISAGDPSQWVAGAQRTDTIMLVHLAADRSAIQVISFPRDSWVEIPGYGDAKINAAFSYGGPTLLIRTVEQLTGVHIDHFALLDFEGFVEITDALGGVTITVPKATGDSRGSFKAGTQRMDGDTALRYVRQRKNLPGGDFDRIRRQQNWIRSVTREMLSLGTLVNPLKLSDSLNGLAKAIATDDGFTIGEMRSLAISARAIRGEDLTFFTVPVEGTARSPDRKQAIVILDKAKDAALWKAVVADTVGAWVEANDPSLLGSTVN